MNANRERLFHKRERIHIQKLPFFKANTVYGGDNNSLHENAEVSSLAEPRILGILLSVKSRLL